MSDDQCDIATASFARKETNVKNIRPIDQPSRTISYLALHFAGHIELDAERTDTMHVIHAAGRASRLYVPAGWLSLYLPLAGRLQFGIPDGDWEAQTGRMQVWRDTELKVDCRSSGWWLGLAGPLEAWRRRMRPLAGHGFDAGIFPRQSECPRALRRLLVRLARCARGDVVAAEGDMLLDATCVALLEQQSDLRERLQRCSGRTLQRRQQTLLRLLRVRQLIETQCDSRPDLARLARTANYSPWHLIRMYRDVFDETPSEYASRLRLERAWSMVRDTRLPICEITEALGFESQSSFCRAFKHAYGATTGDVRHGHATTARQHALSELAASRAA